MKYIEVACAYNSLAQEVKFALEFEKLEIDNSKPLTIVLDKPVGFALNTLLHCKAEGRIVVTDNPCPEYWEDLWELKPQVLMAGGHRIKELVSAIQRASKGANYRKTPHYKEKLTKRERDALRSCAMGLTNKQVGERLGISERTIKNYMSVIFSEFGFQNREQAILYYWGLWQWLPHNVKLGITQNIS